MYMRIYRRDQALSSTVTRLVSTLDVETEKKGRAGRSLGMLLRHQLLFKQHQSLLLLLLLHLRVFHSSRLLQLQY